MKFYACLFLGFFYIPLSIYLFYCIYLCSTFVVCTGCHQQFTENWDVFSHWVIMCSLVFWPFWTAEIIFSYHLFLFKICVILFFGIFLGIIIFRNFLFFFFTHSFLGHVFWGILPLLSVFYCFGFSYPKTNKLFGGASVWWCLVIVIPIHTHILVWFFVF